MKLTRVISTYSNTEFYNELELSLPTSDAEQRRIWASAIIENEFDLKEFSKLLRSENKVATRFLWLLSEIGEKDPSRLFRELPFFFELSDEIKHLDFKTSFATYWLIAGVPLENEARAIDLLFGWLQSAHTNVTTKSRSLFVLFKLTNKYPELKNELKLCLEDQMEKNTNDFSKRARKVLKDLDR